MESFAPVPIHRLLRFSPLAISRTYLITMTAIILVLLHNRSPSRAVVVAAQSGRIGSGSAGRRSAGYTARHMQRRRSKMHSSDTLRRKGELPQVGSACYVSSLQLDVITTPQLQTLLDSSHTLDSMEYSRFFPFTVLVAHIILPSPKFLDGPCLPGFILSPSGACLGLSIAHWVHNIPPADRRLSSAFAHARSRALRDARQQIHMIRIMYLPGTEPRTSVNWCNSRPNSSCKCMTAYTYP